jgi:hypothetical protein
MLTNIIASIISTQYEREFRHNKELGMVVKFSLSPDYEVEDGYRNLSILIYDFGFNYVGVYAKLDWTVIRKEWLYDTHEYIRNDTDWILMGYHDSGWRDSINSLLYIHRERIVTIDWLFDGWYKNMKITPTLTESLRSKIRQRDGGERTLAELEFKFEVKP